MGKSLPGGFDRLTSACGPHAAAWFTFICRSSFSRAIPRVRFLASGEAGHARNRGVPIPRQKTHLRRKAVRR